MGSGYKQFLGALPKSLRNEFLLRCIRPCENDYDKLYWDEHGRDSGLYAYDCISKEMLPSTADGYKSVKFAQPYGYVDANQKDDYGNHCFILKRYWIKLELFKGTLEDFAAKHAATTVNGLTFHPSLGNILCNDVHYYLMPMVHLLNLAEEKMKSVRLFDLL